MEQNIFKVVVDYRGCHSKGITFNKTSYFEYVKFITEDLFTKYRNITTKLNWKLFTKVI